MIFIRLFIQIGILFIFYGLGVVIQNIAHLPIPGSVIGMILLFLCLTINIFNPKYVEVGAGFMVKHLVLFFIPATVGIISYYTVFSGHGMWLLVIAMGSTGLVMLSSGWVSQWFAHKRGVENE